MKKLFLSFVAVLIGSMTANAATINKAILQHNGEVTLFDGDKVQDAVNAAVDGDIIYLTLGTFQPFNVTKKITIRGAGETSVINGNVTISIPGSPKLTMPVLETLNVSGTVNVGAQADDLILRKCKIGNITIEAQVDGAIIDRCYITNTLTLSSYIKGMTVVNTKLYAVQASSGATNNTTFVNCNFFQLYPTYFSGTIINSIVQGPYRSSSDTLNSTVLINSVFNQVNYSGYSFSIGSSSVTQNCYYVNQTRYVSDACTCSPSSSYVGTDGTIVGIYGGDTPFTLVPSVPKVTSSDLDLDLEQKKLNVTLTVSPQ